jgi:hypothetical protein
MARKKEILRLGFDSGASAIKCHASSGDCTSSLVLSPAAIQQHSQTLNAYRCPFSTDLIHRAFVGVGDNYVAVGKLADMLGATQSVKQLKSDTIVYKILAVVSIMAQRLDLGCKFDLQLGCLLPPGEFCDLDRIRSDLISALASFDTPVGIFNVRLVGVHFYIEGMGIAQLLKANNRKSFGTGIVLMAGHRNLSFHVTESNEMISCQTRNLGFIYWVKAVIRQTYDYDSSSLTAAIADYWIHKDVSCLRPILRNTAGHHQAEEIDRLVEAIKIAHADYCTLIFDWLNDSLPSQMNESIVAGGVSEILEPELIEYFSEKLIHSPKYGNKPIIFNAATFKLPTLDVPSEYQNRMADVYCLWRYLMPELLLRKSKSIQDNV